MKILKFCFWVIISIGVYQAVRHNPLSVIAFAVLISVIYNIESSNSKISIEDAKRLLDMAEDKVVSEVEINKGVNP